MARAKVTIERNDLSTRVSSAGGVSGGIVGAFKRGPLTPTLVTSAAQFLKQYTPDERLKVGYSQAYYSALAFLAKANRLYVVRATNTALYGGVVLQSKDASDPANSAVSAGQADPEKYVFGSDEIILIHQSDPGDWANSEIAIQVKNSVDSPADVKEINAFKIYVYKNNALKETFLCSRDPSAKDGFGRNLYVENVLLASEYIRAVDNAVVSKAILPHQQTTNLAFVKGSDGLAVADPQLITALGFLANPNDVSFQLLLDGGYATAAYHKKLISVAESRGDCVAILSTPVASENAATYINNITTYRSTTLNADSSAAALYSPHVVITDEDTNRDVTVSPDGYVAAEISAVAQTGRIWNPQVGKGKLNVNDVNRRYTDGDLDALTDIGVNPIRSKPGKGISLWGQHTLQIKASATDRLNVKLLLITIEPAIVESLEAFHWEINDADTRKQITSVLDAYMRDVQAGRGVYAYRVICDDTNNSPDDVDNYRLNVWLYIEPVKGIEQIRFVVNILRTGGVTTSIG